LGTVVQINKGVFVMGKWMAKISGVIVEYNDVKTTYKCIEVSKFIGVSLETLRRWNNSGSFYRDGNKYNSDSLLYYFRNKISLLDIVNCRYMNVKSISIKYDITFKQVLLKLEEPDIISVTGTGYYDTTKIGDKLNRFSNVTDDRLKAIYELVKETANKRGLILEEMLK
jgi:hypothetical protein